MKSPEHQLEFGTCWSIIKWIGSVTLTWFDRESRSVCSRPVNANCQILLKPAIERIVSSCVVHTLHSKCVWRNTLPPPFFHLLCFASVTTTTTTLAHFFPTNLWATCDTKYTLKSTHSYSHFNIALDPLKLVNMRELSIFWPLSVTNGSSSTWGKNFFNNNWPRRNFPFFLFIGETRHRGGEHTSRVLENEPTYHRYRGGKTT